MADYTNKMILGYSGSKDFLISVLPHEMAHLVFRDFIGFNGEVPLWLDEGVAQWEEENKRFMAKSIVRENLRNRTFLSLNDMMNLDVRLIKHADKLHLHTSLISGKPSFIIIDGKTLIELYYLQSTSLVGFLIEQYGTNSFTDFCRQLRDGKSLEDALRSAYSNYLNNLDELENRWVEYLQKE